MSRTRAWKLKSTEAGKKPYSKKRSTKPFHCQEGIGDMSWQTYGSSLSVEKGEEYKMTYKDVKRARRQARELKQALNQRARAILKKETIALINEVK